jgi:hypothetical protein
MPTTHDAGLIELCSRFLFTDLSRRSTDVDVFFEITAAARVDLIGGEKNVRSFYHIRDAIHQGSCAASFFEHFSCYSIFKSNNASFLCAFVFPLLSSAVSQTLFTIMAIHCHALSTVRAFDARNPLPAPRMIKRSQNSQSSSNVISQEDTAVINFGTSSVWTNSTNGAHRLTQLINNPHEQSRWKK